MTETFGRPLLDERNLTDRGYGLPHPQMVRRRAVLRETIDQFRSAEPSDSYKVLALANVERWHAERRMASGPQSVQVIKADWGQAALSLTRQYGTTFAVLNMANAFLPGGRYVEGATAQEENMFRRTDCHFYITPEEYDRDLDRYRPEMTELLSATNGRVYLDVEHPRVCIRGPENPERADLGYSWLRDDEVFPFYELRAAAQDLRYGSRFSETDARKRIAAQLDTLIDAGVKHAVLGASGCGAFLNPAEQVAGIYRQEIIARSKSFTAIAFAIRGGGYGPDAYTPFRRVLDSSLALGGRAL